MATAIIMTVMHDSKTNQVVHIDLQQLTSININRPNNGEETSL